MKTDWFCASLERFSFERRKVIGFAITMPHDWLKKLAPYFYPIRSKTKTNRNSLARVFPRFASATCNYYEFWLVYCNVYGFGDWLEWLLWFWFYDAQLKTALLHTQIHTPRHAWARGLKPAFHMSGKSQTIGDFTFGRPSQILPIYRIFARDLFQISRLWIWRGLELSNLGDW